MWLKTCPLDVCLHHFRKSVLVLESSLNFLPSDFFLIRKGLEHAFGEFLE